MKELGSNLEIGFYTVLSVRFRNCSRIPLIGQNFPNNCSFTFLHLKYYIMIPNLRKKFKYCEAVDVNLNIFKMFSLGIKFNTNFTVIKKKRITTLLREEAHPYTSTLQFRVMVVFYDCYEIFHKDYVVMNGI